MFNKKNKQLDSIKKMSDCFSPEKLLVKDNGDEYIAQTMDPTLIKKINQNEDFVTRKVMDSLTGTLIIFLVWHKETNTKFILEYYA